MADLEGASESGLRPRPVRAQARFRTGSCAAPTPTLPVPTRPLHRARTGRGLEYSPRQSNPRLRVTRQYVSRATSSSAPRSAGCFELIRGSVPNLRRSALEPRHFGACGSETRRERRLLRRDSDFCSGGESIASARDRLAERGRARAPAGLRAGATETRAGRGAARCRLRGLGPPALVELRARASSASTSIRQRSRLFSMQYSSAAERNSFASAWSWRYEPIAPRLLSARAACCFRPRTRQSAAAPSRSCAPSVVSRRNSRDPIVTRASAAVSRVSVSERDALGLSSES